MHLKCLREYYDRVDLSFSRTRLTQGVPVKKKKKKNKCQNRLVSLVLSISPVSTDEEVEEKFVISSLRHD